MPRVMRGTLGMGIFWSAFMLDVALPWNEDMLSLFPFRLCLSVFNRLELRKALEHL